MRDAVADVRLRRAGERCLELAIDALPRLGAAELVPRVSAFGERYTTRGRCPADDLLELTAFPAAPPAQADRADSPVA
jgi:glutamate--cysteine ligase